MTRLLLPYKDFNPKNLPQVAQRLHDDFQALERWGNGLPAPMSLAVAGNPSLTGAVVLNAGAGVNLSESGQNITIAAVPQTQARGFGAFFPGTLTAQTIHRIVVSNPVLTQLDVYLETADSGTSGSSCANVVVSGSTAGSLTLPLSGQRNDYHIKGTPSQFGGAGIYTSTNLATPLGKGFTTFSTTAAGQIGSFLTYLYGTVRTTGEFVRIGIANPVTLQRGSTIPALGSIPWLSDTTGAPAFIDVPIANFATNPPVGGYTFLLNNPVNVPQAAASFTVVYACINAGKTGYGTSRLNNNFGNAPGYTGNISSINTFANDSNNTSTTWVNSSAAAYDAWIFYGAGTGAQLTGDVLIAVTLTGTPATPGANANIAIQV